MRASPLLFVLVLGGCFNVRIPRGLPITAHVTARATVRADVHVEAAPAAPVAIQGAPVVEFFGIPLEGARDVVFVLDVSGSMDELAQGQLAQLHVQPPPAAPQSTDPNAPPPGANSPAPPDPNAPPAPAPAMSAAKKIDVAKAELVEALQRLPAGTRVNVVFFNSDLDAYSPAGVQLDEGTRATMVQFVEHTQADGSTALAPAMRAAFLMNSPRVVLLSDGLGNVGGGADDVLRDAREAMHGGVRIDTIGLGSGQDAALLGGLASESGGLYQAL